MKDTFEIIDGWKPYYEFLERLRVSGQTNMYAAAPLLAAAAQLSQQEANSILINWMHNYDRLAEMYGWRNNKK